MIIQARWRIMKPVFAGVSARMTRMSGPNETVLRQREAEKRGVLQSHYLFGKLDPNHIDRLASSIVERSVGRGATIFAKDDPGSSLFAIRKGRRFHPWSRD
jgi:hypothetical protein